MNNEYILNIIISNLIPLSYRSNIKNKEDTRLNEIIENVIQLWKTSTYTIDNIIYTLSEKIMNKEILFLNSIDDYVPFFSNENNLINKYKTEVINVFNVETENIEEIYTKLNNTQKFSNTNFEVIKSFFDKYKNDKIYIGINDNNFYSFYLLSFESPSSIIKDSWIFMLDKPLYKLNIYMILLIKK
jgi:hypothetical protein